MDFNSWKSSHWRFTAPGLVFLLALAWHWHDLASRFLLTDEDGPWCAMDAIGLSQDPYKACPRFVYMYPLAVAIAELSGAASRHSYFVALRILNTAAATVVALMAARRTRLPPVAHIALAAALVTFAPPLGLSVSLGNLSTFAAGLALGATAILTTRPVFAGMLLSGSLLVKPSALAIPLVVLFATVAPTQGNAVPRWKGRFTIGLGVTGFSALLATLRPCTLHLPAPRPGGASIAAFLEAAGLQVPTVAVSVLALGMIVLFARRLSPFGPERLADFLCCASVIALPVLWGHSFAIVTPLLVAVVAGWGRYPTDTPRDRFAAALTILAVVAIISTQPLLFLANELHSSVLRVLPLAALGFVAFVHFTRPAAPQDPSRGWTVLR